MKYLETGSIQGSDAKMNKRTAFQMDPRPKNETFL